MKMEQTRCSETSAIEHHTPGNNPYDYTKHSEHGESLKSRIIRITLPLQRRLRERVSVMHYTCIACLVTCCRIKIKGTRNVEGTSVCMWPNISSCTGGHVCTRAVLLHLYECRLIPVAVAFVIRVNP
jgi:hypothetical protein